MSGIKDKLKYQQSLYLRHKHAAINSCINEQLIAYELRASLYRYTFMNTDMNQYLIFRLRIGMLISYCKKMTAYKLKCLCWASSLAICAYRAHF